MAMLPTAEDKARKVLEIYKHFGSRPGHVLMTNNFVARAARMNLSVQDLADGLEHGMSLGWFEETPAGSMCLTEAGFAEM